MPTEPLHLAVALDGAGWHPAAWREPSARPAELFDARYWADLVREAEAGWLDLVTIEDALGLQTGHWSGPDPRTDQVRGRLDAVLIAARVAPTTSGIGVVPTAVATHTEPFHLSKSIATLDFVSSGRAGVRVQVSARAHEAAHFGRRTIPRFGWAERDTPEVRALIDELFDEARDWIEVVRRLWDSWEDDAEIRDAASGRFVDVDRLHYIDFEGARFSVRGPSITPRPPQGQPVVSVLAHQSVPYRLAATSADLVYVTPHSTDDARGIVDEVRREQQSAGRGDDTLHVWGDLVVVLDDSAAAARARVDRLDEVAGEVYRSDAQIFTGTAAELADLLVERQSAGLSGFRLRPLAIPDDLVRITRELVPELQRRGAFRAGYEAATLRGLLGLSRPANRYAA
ncbi:Flavin-dependent oxidoreductase, luciferase family (includes alkanesulfonate monooxygenase SsuD and methylene tetrahydromethanopterin reductase) [Jatrophihabitans endophyticus]|uniref:Flavin-dependent oxidoreductase, luciferase family (Includes alkanesulfonate monooxygenase SsuD and methylene tetrahydromethanopterin reductase) n=1 Tax=Jatrophihabitans endophyticus TaxID=1206085 RepID=A0A1M5DUS1_9ACTN|nr:LLM class flavin-dependent oxidoreductase [Jatrophihabitans endophyticus]SHF70591.1 Flavin-dependent oxidoreductase, luciferase family (includes alkanesulfonate monooxygenase SsuD and methylene tetrahydromethanopterin reductase) [Jatrophihabitans endophyticus]